MKVAQGGQLVVDRPGVVEQLERVEALTVDGEAPQCEREMSAVVVVGLDEVHVRVVERELHRGEALDERISLEDGHSDFKHAQSRVGEELRLLDPGRRSDVRQTREQPQDALQLGDAAADVKGRAPGIEHGTAAAAALDDPDAHALLLGIRVK